MGNVFGPYYREVLRKKVSAVKLENKKVGKKYHFNTAKCKLFYFPEFS